MSCDPVDVTLENGRRIRGIVCSRGARKEPGCQESGCGSPTGFLCDFPKNSEGRALLAAGKPIPDHLACSRRICSAHVTEISADRHHCPRHVGQVHREDGQLDMFGGGAE